VKKAFFFLSVLAALVFAITNCGDDVGVADGKGDVPDTLRESNLFIGEWDEIGSIDGLQRKVVFTDATITAWSHGTYTYPDGVVLDWEEKWFDGIEYQTNNDTLTLLNNGTPPWGENFFETPFKFHSNDTLFINHFIITIATAGFPMNTRNITLRRRCSNEN
jgi:hypothetical protein